MVLRTSDFPSDRQAHVDDHRVIHRRLNDVVSVRDYGAVGDGKTDDTAAIQNAISVAKATRSRQVYFPAGEYSYTETIKLDSDGLRLIGAGSVNRADVAQDYGTVLAFSGANEANAIELLNRKRISLESLSVFCDKVGGHTGHGIYINRATSSYPQLRAVTVYQAGGNGIYAQDNWQVSWYDVKAQDCGSDGVAISGMNASLWHGGGATHNDASGCIMGSLNTRGCNALAMLGLEFAENAVHGLHVSHGGAATEMHGITVQSCYFENNGRYSMKLGEGNSAYSRFRHCVVQANVMDDDVFLNSGVDWLTLGPNELRGACKYVLAPHPGKSRIMLFGPEAELSITDPFWYGETWFISILDPELGLGFKPQA